MSGLTVSQLPRDRNHQVKEIGTLEGHRLFAYLNRDPEVLETVLVFTDDSPRVFTFPELLTSGRDYKLNEVED